MERCICTMERKEYSAGATKHSFWFMEFRNEVKLLSEGKSFEEIKELCRNENIFAASTPERASQIFSTVSSRIKAMGESFYPVFLNGECVYTSPSVMELRDYCTREKNTLWEETKRLINPQEVYVDLSNELYQMKRQLLEGMGRRVQ